MSKYFGFDKNFNLKEIPEIKRKNPENNNFLLAKYASIGYYLAIPILSACFLGYLIDLKVGSHFFVGAGIIIGAIGTFYNLGKLYQDAGDKH